MGYGCMTPVQDPGLVQGRQDHADAPLLSGTLGARVETFPAKAISMCLPNKVQPINYS